MIATGVASVTVKVAEQVTLAPQVLVTVQVTVVVPPQAFGATGVAGLVVIAALQPPLKVVVANQLANAASMVAWV